MWRAGCVPIVDAVTFADGRMVLFEMIEQPGQPDQIRPSMETTLEAFTEQNPDWLAEVTPLVELALPSWGQLQAGEGSQGADGFIALLDEEGDLRYSLFCTRSNPFVNLSLGHDGMTVRATSTLGVEWSFPLNTPLNITTRFTAIDPAT